MKTLIVLGSPRKKGNSELLIEQIESGIKEAGSSCERIRLEGMDIHPCLGCGSCEKTGRCVIQDDMQGLYDKIDGADRLIIASPIYFYGVTAQTKAFIDRCQALWSRKYILKVHQKTDIPKQGYLVSVSATKGDRIFEGAVLTVQYGLDAMDYEYGGEFLVRGVDERGAISKIKDKLEQARQFGLSIVEK